MLQSALVWADTTFPPQKTVLRRFDRGIYNLFHHYRALLTPWVLFDNSGEEPHVVAKETGGVLMVFDDTLFHVITTNAEVS